MRHLGVLMVVSLLVVLLSTVATAQSNVVTINPLGFVLGAYNISYETTMDESASVQIGGQYVSWELGSGEVSGFGAGASLRYYLRQSAPHGFYIGPGGSVAFVRDTSEDLGTGGSIAGTAIALGTSAIAGYQWITDGGFAVNLSAGISIIFSDLEEASGVAPGLGFGIGYGW